MNKEKIQTRKDEVRYITSDPMQMLNKFLAKNVFRTYKETFIDKETGDTRLYRTLLHRHTSQYAHREIPYR